MTATPTEVTLTSRSSALAQRVLAAVTIAALAGGLIAIIVTGSPWWATALWALCLLIVAFLMLALWFAAGTMVPGEVVDSSVHEESDETTYEFTLWIPAPNGGFQARHRCSRHVCSETAKHGGGWLTVLVDPEVRTWAVVHR
ncbi:hypothetical protein BBK82_39010 [Lentzea guizhouensis]|uniref:Uncharacterized protein n=1 Tax=Lentzea guizhouensis TaxID=1586287 RepID=A0A1B2HTR8_9PSEU|nr:hypothetical protein [Lentzea guizhouensis]ANZ41088.1 hypothetical protein BBK82_39010 [Lentzea guizhouensis]